MTESRSRLQRSAVLALLLLTLLWSGPVWGQEPSQAEVDHGSLLEINPTGTYSPGEVDSRVAGRFRNNGESPPAAVTTVDTYLIRYESQWPDGETAQITAQLFVPRAMADPASLFVFGPGSTGLVEVCAPSRPFVDSRNFETYNAYTLAYAGQGFVSIMPNYMGFFDVGVIQPYFNRIAEGRVMLDAIRAAHASLDDLGLGGVELPSFVAGYSQGGHAAFAAADLHAEYAPDAPLAGVVGFGPTTIMSNLFLEFTFVAPWVIHSVNAFEPERIDSASMLREPYLSSLAADAERLCILEAQRYYPSSPDGLFRPEFVSSLRQGTLESQYPEVAALFDENDAGLSDHQLPAIILQGVDDPVVHIESQNAFVMQLCEDGSRVRYPNYLRTRHETRYIGFNDAIAWMRSVASGEEPPTDCEAVFAQP